MLKIIYFINVYLFSFKLSFFNFQIVRPIIKVPFFNFQIVVFQLSNCPTDYKNVFLIFKLSFFNFQIVRPIIKRFFRIFKLSFFNFQIVRPIIKVLFGFQFTSQKKLMHPFPPPNCRFST